VREAYLPLFLSAQQMARGAGQRRRGGLLESGHKFPTFVGTGGSDGEGATRRRARASACKGSLSTRGSLSSRRERLSPPSTGTRGPTQTSTVYIGYNGSGGVSFFPPCHCCPCSRLRNLAAGKEARGLSIL